MLYQFKVVCNPWVYLEKVNFALCFLNNIYSNKVYTEVSVLKIIQKLQLIQN